MDSREPRCEVGLPLRAGAETGAKISYNNRLYARPADATRFRFGGHRKEQLILTVRTGDMLGGSHVFEHGTAFHCRRGMGRLGMGEVVGVCDFDGSMAVFSHAKPKRPCNDRRR